MNDGASMPAIEGVTIGMTRDNCLAYCYNLSYKRFGERSKMTFRTMSYGRRVRAGVLASQWLGVTRASESLFSFRVVRFRTVFSVRYETVMEWLATPCQTIHHMLFLVFIEV